MRSTERAFSKTRRRVWEVLGPALGALTVCSFASPAFAGGLIVTLDRAPCPDPAGAARYVERRASLYLTQQPDLTLAAVSYSRGELLLRLTGPSSFSEMAIPLLPRDCPALPATLVLLLRSWATRDWGSASAAAEAHPDPPRPERRPVAEGRPAPVLVPQPAPASRARVTLLGGGTVALAGVGASLSASGSVELALAPPWGCALVASHALPVRANHEPGRVSFSSWALGLAARVSLPMTPRSRVDFLAGPALSVVTVRGQGFIEDVAAHRLDIAGMLTARWGWKLSERVTWVLDAELWARPREELLSVDDEVALTVSRTRLGLLTGVSLDLL